MTSAELRAQTASEPLTLDEEYEMQRKWQLDEDKLTFIILSGEALNPAAQLTSEILTKLPMIGDVNLFLKGLPHEEEFEAEVEVMIAEPAFRCRGLASAAVQLMLSYATSANVEARHHPLPVPQEKLVARIGEANTPSIRLFEKLGFAVTKRVAVFEEVELRFGGRATGWRTGQVRMLGGHGCALVDAS
ncbi:N-acetyltransferase 9-like protein [Sparassis crispa]|uniref:N-acetyltransferase 9-like protein n=1 Tax=Sparassis crispa TaxID=139825 RepID=A0A401G982_9APHY|nr:N-acetyltransferase 9-like protein [Sparassis crispa]GBE78730.1 N-acetyltransferase 9-like protein [Sparassis crispa]